MWKYRSNLTSTSSLKKRTTDISLDMMTDSRDILSLSLYWRLVLISPSTISIYKKQAKKGKKGKNTLNNSVIQKSQTVKHLQNIEQNNFTQIDDNLSLPFDKVFSWISCIFCEQWEWLISNSRHLEIYIINLNVNHTSFIILYFRNNLIW